MKIGLAVIVVLLLIALILGSSYVARRNQMAVKREAVNAAWAQVDVVLQRRADLIPNLVETVKGFAQHEEAVFGEIAKARAAYLNASTPAEKIAANSQLDASLAKVLVLTARISSASRTNWREPKTASPSSVAGTTKPCRTTTPTSLFSRTAWWRASAASRGTTLTSRPNRARAKPPK